MELTLSWDLFIVVFFAIVITYSFIIGMHEAVKIVIATYIAIVSVQGIGNIITRITGESQSFLRTFGISLDITVLASTKLVIFIAAIIFLAVRGGFEIDYTKDTGGIVHIVLTGIFGFATAGLILSTLLVFVSNVPLLDSSITDSLSVSPIIQQSTLMQAMILNQDLWFSLPALLLLAVGFLHNERSDEA